MSVGIAAINLAIDSEGDGSLLQALSNPDVGLHSVTHHCSATYQTRLRDYKHRKIQAATERKPENAASIGSGWTMNRTREGYKYYFNVHSMEASWERTEDMKKDHSLLTKEEIQVSCIPVAIVNAVVIVIVTNKI